MITINRVINGAVVSCPRHPDAVLETAYVFDEESPEGLRDLLCDLAEELGRDQTRYSRKFLAVVLRHGDKYGCPGCELCREGA